VKTFCDTSIRERANPPSSRSPDAAQRTRVRASRGPSTGSAVCCNLRLGREEKAGRTYSDAQREWLMAIRDHLSVNIEIRPEDMTNAPEFSGRGGIVRARALFGVRLPVLLG
jgi:hypothetical protein